MRAIIVELHGKFSSEISQYSGSITDIAVEPDTGDLWAATGTSSIIAFKNGSWAVAFTSNRGNLAVNQITFIDNERLILVNAGEWVDEFQYATEKTESISTEGDTRRFFTNGIHDSNDRGLLSLTDNDITEIGSWDKDCIAKGLACAYIKINQPEYDSFEDRFYNRIPDYDYVVEGLKISWPGQGQPKYTNNAAAIRYWWLRERRGIPASAIDEASFKVAFDYCEHQVNKTLTDKDRRYTIDGVIVSGDDPDRVEKEMNFAWAGNVVEVGGKHYFAPGMMQESKLHIHENMIYSRGRLDLAPALGERFNSISMSLSQDIENDFNTSESPELQDENAIARDGRRLHKDFGKRAFVVDNSHAERLMNIHLRLANIPKKYTYTFYPGDDLEIMGLLPADRITITDSKQDLDQAPMQVISRDVDPKWRVVLTLQPAPDGLYSDMLATLNPDGSFTAHKTQKFIWPFSDTLEAKFTITNGSVVVDGTTYNSTVTITADDSDSIVQLNINAGGNIVINPGDADPIAPPEQPPADLAGLRGSTTQTTITWLWNPSARATGYKYRFAEGNFTWFRCLSGNNGNLI